MFVRRRHCRPGHPRPWAGLLGLLLVVSCLAGCGTSFGQYVRSGFKVGPAYQPPATTVTAGWIDERDERLAGGPELDFAWWRALNDPVLDSLVQTAYGQNLTLQEAGYRVLEARSQRAIAAGNLFPQSQTLLGSYRRQQLSLQAGLTAGGAGGFPGVQRNFDVWATGPQLAWELDFWGRFRRSVEAADAHLAASVAGYHDAVVILIADVAATYVEIRIAEQRLDYVAATCNSSKVRWAWPRRTRRKAAVASSMWPRR